MLKERYNVTNKKESVERMNASITLKVPAFRHPGGLDGRIYRRWVTSDKAMATQERVADST